MSFANHLLAWGPAVLWAAALFFLSALPGAVGPDWVNVNDKVAHVGAYAVLGGTLAWGRHRSATWMDHRWLLVVGALYAVSDEIHQMYVPGRSADPADLLADVVGLLLGYGTTWAILGRTKDARDPAGPGAVDDGDTR